MTLAILSLSGTCEFSKDRFMIWEIGLESMLLHDMMSLGDIRIYITVSHRSYTLCFQYISEIGSL